MKLKWWWPWPIWGRLSMPFAWLRKITKIISRNYRSPARHSNQGHQIIRLLNTTTRGIIIFHAGHLWKRKNAYHGLLQRAGEYSSVQNYGDAAPEHHVNSWINVPWYCLGAATIL
jgi:hypothetical protein